ncbi:MAG: hypothetical protein IT448_06725 [Phycisphaerales bacterium]|nr:hypothetical protein [Phycisphaerales bacterium]
MINLAQANVLHIPVPDRWPEQTDIISLCHSLGPAPATLLIGLGVVYLLFGFYWYKTLIMVNAICLGSFLGLVIGQRWGNPWVGAFLGGCLSAAITWPQMKYAGAVMGARVGAVSGAGVWASFGMDANFAWTGAMMGLIFFGLMCFILFRGSIMMYTSFQGSIMLVFGILAMTLKYEQVGPPLEGKMLVNHFLLPLMVLIPAIAGILYQQHNHPSEMGGVGGAVKK